MKNVKQPFLDGLVCLLLRHILVVDHLWLLLINELMAALALLFTVVVNSLLSPMALMTLLIFLPPVFNNLDLLAVNLLAMLDGLLSSLFGRLLHLAALFPVSLEALLELSLTIHRLLCLFSLLV